MSVQKNELKLPLPDKIIKFIKYTYKDNSDIIISTIEYTIKHSENHYNDLLTSITPILDETTPAFLNKLFMFNKKDCKSGANCTNEFCLFAHPTTITDDSEDNCVKRIKYNKEVVFNKVDEDKYNAEEIHDYASKFGDVISVTKLNKGKFLIVFDSPDSAQSLIDSVDPVMSDSNIKKFFNVLLSNYAPNIASSAKKRAPFNILDLLIEQENYIKELESTGKTDVAALKIVSLRIKNFIKSKEEKYCNKPAFKSEDKVATKSSLYSNLFK